MKSNQINLSFVNIIKGLCFSQMLVNIFINFLAIRLKDKFNKFGIF
jgi:hypothetical protein